MSASGWIIIGVIAIVALWVLITYNRLIAMRQHCNQAFADVDVQLKQRHDLVPNLVETVKAYAAHERGTLDAIVNARTAALAARGPTAQAAAENLLTDALRQLFALAEAYPNLKADSNFRALQAELTAIEDKLASARRSFNNAVQRYNTGLQQFPTTLFAGALRFTPHEFFDLREDRRLVQEAPQVKF
jgi:LemA protein